mmetsp:Transcript_15098/g.45107  ORF Transcript_15098/g.45107 Transcript_15098/m.45107 type:complete len:157 (-) Transcript_15098:565-1035(-)
MQSLVGLVKHHGAVSASTAAATPGARAPWSNGRGSVRALWTLVCLPLRLPARLRAPRRELGRDRARAPPELGRPRARARCRSHVRVAASRTASTTARCVSPTGKARSASAARCLLVQLFCLLTRRLHECASTSCTARDSFGRYTSARRTRRRGFEL